MPHINRRDFLKAATAAAGVAACGLGAIPLTRKALGTPASRPSRPNVIVILADQLRYQSLGYAGDTRAKTPNLDRLAAQSISFRQAVASTPVCAAFRASFFTGKYASSTGMAVNELRINPDHRCLGHCVTDAGYQTSYIGKWHLWDNVSENTNLARSFIPPEKREYRLGWDGEWAACNFNHKYYSAFYFGDKPEQVAIKGYEPVKQTEMAIDFVNRKAGRDQPFYMTLSYGPPHDPWERKNVPAEFYEQFADTKFELPPNYRPAPDPYMDRNAEPGPWKTHWTPNIPEYMRCYYAMTASLDACIGRLLKAVEDAGIANDTIIMFSSDHGEMFGAQGRVFKMIFYEEAARIPLLLRWPGQIQPGVSDACITTPDLMPTILGLLGIQPPAAVEGADLSHVCRGKPGPEPEFAFLQGMGHTYQWKDGFEWRAIRDKQFTYARYRVDGSELLFDNVHDPLQMKDLSGLPTHKATLEKMRKQMADKMKSLGDTFECCTWYRDHWTDGNRNIIAAARGKFATK